MADSRERNGFSSLLEMIDFLREYLAAYPDSQKNEIEIATAERFGLKQKRSVYLGPDFAIRFSTANTPSFSNVVLSLSTLRHYDAIPFVVCIVRQSSVELLLANSTFLKKISHSSQKLRIDNVKGSFLGHDILREYEGIKNIPEEFEKLFLIHKEFTWEENVAKLVENTDTIIPTGVRFSPTQIEQDNILHSPEIAHFLSHHFEYLKLNDSLAELVKKYRADILKAAKTPNINLCGNKIEQIITQAVNAHNVEDLSYTLEIGSIVMVDIKTKLLNLSSSPKGYNVDKVLRRLSPGNTTFSFFFIGINPTTETLFTHLVSIFDKRVINATKLVFHWAGRNSRGVTQLTGDLSFVFSSDFEEDIDVPIAKKFLHDLMDSGVKDN